MALPESVKLDCIELFPESIPEMPGPAHVPVVPVPVEGGVSFPFEPPLINSYLPEEAAHIPLGIGAAGYLAPPCTGEGDNELVQITPPA